MSIFYRYISLILYWGILPQRKIYIHNIQRYLHSSPKSFSYFILISPTLCTTTSTVHNTQILCAHGKCVYVHWYPYLAVIKFLSGAGISNSIWGLVRNTKSTLSDPLPQKLWEWDPVICGLTSPPGDFHEH